MNILCESCGDDSGQMCPVSQVSKILCYELTWHSF